MWYEIGLNGGEVSMEIYSWINTGQGVIEKGLSYDLVSVSLN
jgi:hypothetical protein